MNFLMLGTDFLRFPTDNFGHWLLAGALAYGIALLMIFGLYDEYQINKHKRLGKTSWGYAILYAFGVIGLIFGIALSAFAPSLFLILLGISSTIIYLSLAARIRKKEMKFVESDELIDTRGDDKNDSTRLIQ
ncbi:hypothetical protein A2482_01105 [Candidatus Falkowbacteria bacterium RIFOXYC2_FULL_48_21]|uniref:Uncharacterized protein n=1 Tax=Candidatus Falkowbacteria bacterium RIFOXYC2_FULL_48_21 TaxID=1798005 RepID=A0A1F5T7Z2_9BACT|nr:MAG: hypothetical protein A2482_01105 [Candidatus Falkowbacteria bacterium RIFOXYC2_FULL_48_21]